MNNYKHKYLKYKEKYLNLYKNIYGGIVLNKLDTNTQLVYTDTSEQALQIFKVENKNFKISYNSCDYYVDFNYIRFKSKNDILNDIKNKRLATNEQNIKMTKVPHPSEVQKLNYTSYTDTGFTITSTKNEYIIQANGYTTKLQDLQLAIKDDIDIEEMLKKKIPTEVEKRVIEEIPTEVEKRVIEEIPTKVEEIPIEVERVIEERQSNLEERQLNLEERQSKLEKRQLNLEERLSNLNARDLRF